MQTITEPDRAIARLHAKNGNPAWTYYFSYVPAAQRAGLLAEVIAGEQAWADELASLVAGS